MKESTFFLISHTIPIKATVLK